MPKTEKEKETPKQEKPSETTVEFLASLAGVLVTGLFIITFILQAFEILHQLGRAFRRQRVNHPVFIPSRDDHPPSSQIREVLGDFDLRLPQNVLEMADAQRGLREQM